MRKIMIDGRDFENIKVLHEVKYNSFNSYWGL